jgi:polysaccharide export outer membrane protein
MKRRTASALLTTLLLTLPIARADDAPRPGADALPFAAVATYRLQPGDVIEISVWKEPDLKREALVRSDGGVSFPLAGDLRVAGLTPTEVRVELESRLREFIPDVTASVAVLAINGNQVYVVGKVNRPGVYKFDRPVDVMQVLSLAGGATEFAEVDDIRILRRGADGAQRTFAFEYSRVADGRQLEQNIVLESGDTLVVP